MKNKWNDYYWYLRCLFLVQIQEASKNLNLVSHFHWRHFHRCYFLFPCFFRSFSVLFHFSLALLQKQPPDVFYEKRCSKKCHKIHRPAKRKRLWHRCFPTNFVKFLSTPFLQNTSGRLLLLLIKRVLIS